MDGALGLWHPACWVEEATRGPWVSLGPMSWVPVSAGSSVGRAHTWPASLCIRASSAGLLTFTCEQWGLPWCPPSSDDWEAEPGAHHPLPSTPSWVGGPVQCASSDPAHVEEGPDQG